MNYSKENTTRKDSPFTRNNLPDENLGSDIPVYPEDQVLIGSKNENKLEQLKEKKQNQIETHNAALEYAKLGLHLIPIRSDTKKPSIYTGKDHCDAATIDPVLIYEYFLESLHNPNIGIATGDVSDIIVIDIDGPEGLISLTKLEAELGPLPMGGPVARTPRDDGGKHLFFKYPGIGQRFKSRRINTGLDIKADGGYVVAPPSNGRMWDTDTSADIPELPLPWVHYLAQPKLGESSVSLDDGNQSIPIGNRNNSLFQAGCKMRWQGKEHDEILERLIELNPELCVEPLSDLEIRSIAESVCKYPLGDGYEVHDDEVEKELPVIPVSNDVVSLAQKAWDALTLNQEYSDLFQNTTGLVRIKRTDDQMVEVETLDHFILPYYLNRSAKWIKTKGEKTILTHAPLSVVRDMLADPSPPLRFLNKVITAPIVLDNGDIHSEPGYDSRSRSFYSPAKGLVIRDVTDIPTQEEVQCARELLFEAFCDFPFAGPEDGNPECAHAIALMVQPFARGIIQGSYPLILVEAAGPGTGKTLLVRVALTPAIGVEVPIMPEGRNDEEYRKRLTAALMNYPMVLVIDNVKSALRSPVLAAAITASTWDDRILGKSKIARLPVNCAFVATGNNPSVTSEISRRSIRIRLVAPSDRPWLRDPSEFKHPDLAGWTLENRGDLIWASLILIKNWFAKGKPAPSNNRSLGMFESWSYVMGGILEAAEIKGFLGNLDDFYDSSDSELSQQRAFVATWWDTLGDAEVGTADLFKLFTGEETKFDIDLGTGNEHSQRIRLGKFLAQMKDRQIGDYKVQLCGENQRAILYRLEKVEI